jgi:hypothetical protein
VVLLLFIGVNLVHRILLHVVEQLGVVMYEPSVLLQVYELLILPSHHAHRDVMGVKSVVEVGL